MPSSSPTRCASWRASATASSIVTPETGTSGQTSVAPIRGWAPWCVRMSISSAAFAIPANAPSTTASGSPTNVTTVRFVVAPGSTSSSLTPSTRAIAAVIASITARSRPSLKFGTHSSSLGIANSRLRSPRAHCPPGVIDPIAMNVKIKTS